LSPLSALLLAAGLRTLVLPFENAAEESSHDWKGSAFEEAIASQFDAAGYDVIDPVARNRAFAELGFSPSEPVSRATAITLGRRLAAQRLVLGAFRVSDWRIDVEARVIDLERGVIVGIVHDFASADALLLLSNQVAKNVFRLERDDVPPGFRRHAERRLTIPPGALEASARARLSSDASNQLRLLSHALSREPSYLEARLLYGRLLIAENKPRDAIDVLVAAGADVANHAPTYFELGRAYLQIGEPGSAETVFANLIAIGHDQGAASNNLGVALARQDRFDDAAEAFLRATNKDPTVAVYAFNQAFCLWRSGDDAESMRVLKSAHKRAPYDGELQFLRWKVAAYRSEDDEARYARTAALVLSPQLLNVDLNGVDPWVRPVSREDPAERAELRHDVAEGEDVVALVELFDVWELRARGRSADAIQLLRKSLYRNPGAMAVRRELVELLRESGELEQAVRELHMVLWSDPSADAHAELAEIYLELGDTARAKGEVDKALSIDPLHDGARELDVELTPPSS